MLTLETDFLGRRMPLPVEDDHSAFAEPEPEVASDRGTHAPSSPSSDTPGGTNLPPSHHHLSEASSSRKAVKGSDQDEHSGPSALVELAG